MSGEKDGLMGFNSHNKYPLKEDTMEEAKGENQVRSPTLSARSKMARWTLVLLAAIAFTLWSNGSDAPLSIEQRVDQILSESPLIGRSRSIICRNMPSPDH